MKKLLLVAAFAVAGITGTVSAKSTIEPVAQKIVCTTTTSTQTVTDGNGTTTTTTTTKTECKEVCSCSGN